jgi:hypothetical protein
LRTSVKPVPESLDVTDAVVEAGADGGGGGDEGDKDGEFVSEDHNVVRCSCVSKCVGCNE